MGITVVESLEERAELIEALRGLLDRLCAPDLTLAESKVLRECLSDLLDQREQGGESDQAASLPPIVLPYCPSMVNGP